MTRLRKGTPVRGLTCEELVPLRASALTRTSNARTPGSTRCSCGRDSQHHRHLSRPPTALSAPMPSAASKRPSSGPRYGSRACLGHPRRAAQAARAERPAKARPLPRHPDDAQAHRRTRRGRNARRGRDSGQGSAGRAGRTSRAVQQSPHQDPRDRDAIGGRAAEPCPAAADRRTDGPSQDAHRKAIERDGDHQQPS